ncbi:MULTISPECIES: hypothetical protein [Limnobacter]|jgi:hypothetical protein|uniref:Auto-transporter adhesin head GIN domain-containing protein n=3 Tax=Limnobacter TaxID=131079 RepID=A0ABX6N2T7_9BURK|nr:MULTISPECIES: hypothetical protein [unclassified Limnobacter]MAG79665.1 hypothetical protein [Sutterellaceae bacterium]MBA4313961.1 hypothetical protein [Alcaligenaceae bacterium]PZO16015.1 MAG: hypothetical protein DCE87_07380 [Betaproteobacteria bacterium]MBT83978.1 hypothetical protein [Sutterellaceae bacterium]MDP3273141.1 hypothetical protein [Limnobacter sp.]
MLKQSLKSLSILAALLSMHSVAQATCQGNDCQVEIDANVEFDSSYYLSPNHNGIFIQSNTGTNAAIVDLQNVVMRDNGDITGSAQAVGNNIAISLSSSSKVPVRHVSQSNYGDQLASVNLSQRSTSKTGEVLIEAVSIGNNFSLNLDNTSLAELSVAQCNVSDNVAVAEYRWDPTRLTASATAVGNNISIGGARP